MKKALDITNGMLADKTYLVGDSVTLADIALTCTLFNGMTKVFDPAFRKPFPHVERYFTTLVNNPHFKKVMGAVELCKTAAKAPAPGKAPSAAAAKPKEEAKPAEAAPAPAAPVGQTPEEIEAAAAAVEKAGKKKIDDWLASMPPSEMVMDSWKRLYSNSPARGFRDVCITRLWAGGPVPNSPNEEVFSGFDAKAFSFWFCDYKYNDENTVNFIVMNKVGGFLQRVDYARKYAFGVMCILKKDNLFPIKGVWMFRGLELPPQMLEECPDMDLYTWTKVNLEDAGQKKLLEDIICEEDTIDGMELIEAKKFK